MRRTERPGVLQRLEARAATGRVRVRGRNPALVAVRVLRRSSEVRVPGLAAETCYYLVLSVLPLLTALGASLGLLRRWLDAGAVEAMEQSLVDAVETVLSPELSEDVAVPFVRQLLEEEQVGAALGSVAGALWLGSRVFRAAVRALGDAYRTEERRGVVQLWALSLVFTVAAVLVTTAVLTFLVLGPLLGGGRWLADLLGAGEAFQDAWTIGRWPAALLVLTVFLAWLYQVGQNADTTWREALPGALLATAGLVLLSVGFRAYVSVAGPQGPDVEGGPEAVRIVGEFLGTALAAMLLGWLASMVVLTGGVFNAEWHAARPTEAARPEPPGGDRAEEPRGERPATGG